MRDPFEPRRPDRPLGHPGNPSRVLPTPLLADATLWAAGGERDIGAIFRLAHERAGISVSQMARWCDMTPSRVSSYMNGRSRARDQRVIERVADGLRLPGRMLGLAARPWEAPPRAGRCEQPRRNRAG